MADVNISFPHNTAQFNPPGSFTARKSAKDVTFSTSKDCTLNFTPVPNPVFTVDHVDLKHGSPNQPVPLRQPPVPGSSCGVNVKLSVKPAPGDDYSITVGDAAEGGHHHYKK